ncbi:MAG: hypothetical protein KA784_00095 [Aquabacterium sp.]|nr:hypothetical protein [Ottowia sp.]MBP7501165.1 hypothetical protein [Aquabacterium sp.]
MTAAERLVFLSGRPGRTAGEQLRMIAGALATTGALLVAYSGLPTGTAAEHILVDHVREESGQVFGAGAAGPKSGQALPAATKVSRGSAGGAISAPSAAAKHAPAQVQPSPATGPISSAAPDLAAAAAAERAQLLEVQGLAAAALRARHAHAAQVLSVLAQIELQDEHSITIEVPGGATDEELALIVAAIAAHQA